MVSWAYDISRSFSYADEASRENKKKKGGRRAEYSKEIFSILRSRSSGIVISSPKSHHVFVSASQILKVRLPLLTLNLLATVLTLRNNADKTACRPAKVLFYDGQEGRSPCQSLHSAGPHIYPITSLSRSTGYVVDGGEGGLCHSFRYRSHAGHVLAPREEAETFHCNTSPPCIGAVLATLPGD